MHNSKTIEVRPFAAAGEYEGMVDYFLSGDEAFMAGMGVDTSRLPTRESWMSSLLADHERRDEEKDRLYVAWMYEGVQVGHSSVNKIKVGEEAYFHLHLWRPDLRRGGLGLEFCRRSIDLYFERLRLQRLMCEPYAENAAPNSALRRLGFEFLKRYATVPGAIALPQDVNQYRLTREAWAARRAMQSSAS